MVTALEKRHSVFGKSAESSGKDGTGTLSLALWTETVTFGSHDCLRKKNKRWSNGKQKLIKIMTEGRQLTENSSTSCQLVSITWEDQSMRLSKQRVSLDVHKFFFS